MRLGKKGGGDGTFFFVYIYFLYIYFFGFLVFVLFIAFNSHTSTTKKNPWVSILGKNICQKLIHFRISVGAKSQLPRAPTSKNLSSSDCLNLLPD